FVEWLQGCNNRQSSHKFGNHAKLDEIIAGYFGEQLAQLVLALLRIAAKADGLPADAAGDNVFETDKRSTANEQDVGRVTLDGLLLGVLAAALGRHVAHRSFEHLEEGLLNSFAADVAGDADVLAGLGDFVDFVDVDDSPLRRLDVKIAGVKKLEEKILDVLADVTCLSQGGGIADGKRNIENPCQRPRQKRFAAAGRPNQQNVALIDLDLAVALIAEAQPLVVVVHSDGE